MEVVGIDKRKVRSISKYKEEDEWVTNYRLDSYEKFKKLELPNFGPDTNLDFSKIIYYKNNDRDDIEEQR